MQFCEKCNYATAETVCALCGNKKLRAVEDEDFCYFASMSDIDFEMFEFTLKENGIDAVWVPFYPFGVTHASAGRADGRKVYIRYKDMENAKEIFNTIFGFN